MKRQFLVSFEGSVVIELDDKVIAAVNDEWRAEMYPLHTPEQIAEHIAFNMVTNLLDLKQIDGFADQPNDRARIVEQPEWDMSAREITERRTPKKARARRVKKAKPR